MQKPQPPLPRQILEMPGSPAQNLYQGARLLEQAGQFANREWTQGVKARDAAGQPTALLGGQPLPYNRKNNPAVRYCAAGHVERVCCAQPATAQYQPALLTLLTKILKAPIPAWNDAPGRTAAEVRSLFRQGAARLYREAAAAGLQELAAAAAAAGPETPRESPAENPAPARIPAGVPGG